MKNIIKSIGVGISSFVVVALIVWAANTIGNASSGDNDGYVGSTLEEMEKSIEDLSDLDKIVIQYNEGCECDPDREMTIRKNEYDFYKIKFKIKKVKPADKKTSDVQTVETEEKNTEGEYVAEENPRGGSQSEDEPQNEPNTTDEQKPAEEETPDDNGVTTPIQDSHVPQNVEVKMLGTKTDDDGKKYLEAEISWDADDAVNYNEVLPLLLDNNGGAYIIPLADGQTVGNAPDVPDRVRYRTENGRNILKVRIPIVPDGEEQIVSDNNGTYAKGIREGDNVAIIVSSVTDPTTWKESDYSNPVEFKYTEENVNNQSVFKESATTE